MERRKRSATWNYFRPINDSKASCNFCSQIFSYRTSVSNLKKHIKKIHPTVLCAQDIIIVANSERTEESSSIQVVSQVDVNQPTEETLQLIAYKWELSNQNPVGNGEIIESASDKVEFHAEKSESSNHNQVDNGEIIESVEDATQFHAEKRPITETETEVVQKKLCVVPLRTESWHKNVEKKLLDLFLVDFQPFRIVEDEGFKAFVRALSEDYKLPSRHTISHSLIPAAYDQCFKKVQDTLKTANNVCLTIDCWSSSSNEIFMVVTAHYITHEIKLKNVLLDCVPLTAAHTRANLAQELKKIVEEWDLADKIILVVSENAANIKKAVEDDLGWQHFPCFAHTLNSIVREGIKPFSPILKKVKCIVSCFKRSSTAMEKLLECQQNAGVEEPKKLTRDVCTRWNSTYYMLERFVELENHIRNTCADLDETLPEFTSEELNSCKEICKVLKVLEGTTVAMSGETYPLASLAIVLTNGLFNVFQRLLKKDFTPIVKTVVEDLFRGMKEKLCNFEKSNTLTMCTFLDPRFKNVAFSNPTTSDCLKRKAIKIVSNMVFEETKPASPVVAENLEEDDPDLLLWSSFDKSIAKLPHETAESKAIIEVQRYLEEDMLEKKRNPLEWWNKNKSNYPHLSKIVTENCCALATSVPYERLFSKAGQIFNEKRTRLSSAKIKKILFLNVNKHLID